MPAVRRFLVWLLMGVIATAALFMLWPRTESIDACRPWQQGTRCGAWSLAYDGFGAARGDQDAEGWRYRLEPRTVDHTDQTSAALALSVEGLCDLDVSVRMRTREQLRQPEANPWEVAWLLWHYTDDQHFYYIALKPNGWELGKAHPDQPGAQQFLASGSTPTFPIGPSYDVRIRQVDTRIEVSVDTEPLVEFVDSEAPYLHGFVGLYTEDAAVEFSHVRLEVIEDPETIER